MCRRLRIAQTSQEVANWVSNHRGKLPAGFLDTWEFASQGQFTETDAAEFEVAHVAVLAATFPTAQNFTRGKLRLPFGFGDLCFSSHMKLCLEGKAEGFE